jgi:predicted DNA-binding transcriptional regulator YafY
MRAERLLSLLLDLADGKTHSSAELARKFGVSVRSVYRDMELLSGMGFPIEAEAGRDGGYRVLPGFTFDRSVLGESELAAVAAALGGIERATGSGEAEAARSKLAALLGKAPARRKSWIRIELGQGERDRERIEVLRRAIDEGRLVRLRYRDAEGRTSERPVEPCAVVYLWQSWYLWAYCRLRDGFRLFKLSRVESVQGLMERFEPRPEPSENAWREAWESSPEVEVILEIVPEAGARSDEWFGPQETTAGGGRLVRASFPENDWLLGFLLSFGEGLRVISPESLARNLAERARRVWLANNPGSSGKP